MVKLKTIQCPHSSRLGTPMVTLAGNKLRLNAAFADVANLARFEFVGIYETDSGKIALKFLVRVSDAHPNKRDLDFDWDAIQPPLPPNVVPMQRDGGRKNTEVKGRILSCGQIIEYSSVLRQAKNSENQASRQFLPIYDEESECWVLNSLLAPPGSEDLLLK